MESDLLRFIILTTQYTDNPIFKRVSNLQQTKENCSGIDFVDRNGDFRHYSSKEITV